MDGAGRGLNNLTVRISLIAPNNPFLLDGSGEVIQRLAVDTDHTGIWSAELLANSEFEQADTYYLVDETCAPDGEKWTIRMPGAGVFDLRDLLVFVPPGENGSGPTVPSGVFTWIQNTAELTWPIPHNLGYPPVIEAYEGGDATVDSDNVAWNKRRDSPDFMMTWLTYLSPVSGRAYCS
jgi:hypothetical protein